MPLLTSFRQRFAVALSAAGSWLPEEMMLTIMIFQIDRNTDLDRIFVPDDQKASN